MALPRFSPTNFAKRVVRGAGVVGRGLRDYVVKPAFTRLVAEPGVMAGQAVGTGIAAAASGITGNKSYYDRALQVTQRPQKFNIPLLGEIKTDPAKSYRQMTGKALESASYLYTPTKAVKAVAPLLRGVNQTVRQVGSNIARGAFGGYMGDVGIDLQDPSKSYREAAKPGIGTALGALVPAGAGGYQAGKHVAKTSAELLSQPGMAQAGKIKNPIPDGFGSAADDAAKAKNAARSNAEFGKNAEREAALQMDIETKRQVVDNHPAKTLAKFANRNGEIPEALGQGGKFGKTGDQLSADLKFEDSEAARASYQDYVTAKQSLAEAEGAYKNFKSSAPKTPKAQTANIEPPAIVPERTQAGLKRVEAPTGDPQGLSLSSAESTPKLYASQDLNVKNLNISGKAKDLVTQELESIKPVLESKVGTVLSNKEAMKMADETSKVLNRVVGREQTLQWEAGMLKLRQRLAQGAENGTVTKEFLEDIASVKTLGADIGRKLQSLSIGADPKSVTSKQFILGEVLKATDDMDAVLKASQGVDFNDPKQAAEFYRKFISPKTGEWINLLRYNSMLSSPLTHIVNTASNLVNSAVVRPLTILTNGGVDLLSSAATGRARRAFAGESGAYVSGYLKNFQEATKRFGDVFSGKRGYSNLDVKRSIPLATKGIGSAVEKTLSFPTRVLEGMDQFFSALSEGGEKAALTLRQSKGVKVPRLEEQAAEKAAYTLYRQPLFTEGQGVVLDAIDRVTNLVDMARNSENPIISTVSKFTLPFLHTPTNILKQGLEYSPAGLSTMIGAANKTEQFSKALMGSAVALAGGTLVASNRMTWAEPRTANERNMFREHKMQPYSVKIGDTWYSYAKLPPVIAFPLSMIAAVNDAQKNKKLDQSDADIILGAVSKYGEFFADQSYLKNIGDLVSAISGDKYAGAQLIGNYPQQLVPFRALSGWFARMIDPLQRQIDNKAGFVDKQMQLLMQNIPWVSQKLPPRTGSFGTPIDNSNSVINSFSPVRMLDQSPVQAELYQDKIDLKKATKDAADAKTMAKEDFAPTFNQIQELGNSGNEAEAQAMYEALTDEDRKIYKAMSSAKKSADTKAAKEAMYPTYQKIQALGNSGDEDGAQAMYEALTEKERRIYKLMKKQFE